MLRGFEEAVECQSVGRAIRCLLVCKVERVEVPLEEAKVRVVRV